MNPGHSAYLGISEDAHKKNMRAIHVNAQVTAVTTIFEFMGNCFFTIIFTLMKGQGFPRFTGMVFFMLLHFVGLSYAFLMNTRYNKNRIIQDGWINVLKNILHCGRVSQQPPNIPAINGVQLEATQVTCNKTETVAIDEKSDKNDICIISNKPNFAFEEALDDEKIHEIGQRLKMDLVRSLDKVTFSACYDKTFYLRKEIDGKNGTELYMSSQSHSTPSTSRQEEVQKNIHPNETVQRSNTRQSIVDLRTKILSELLLYIDDEDKYINVFTKLVQIEEAYKNDQDINSLDYTDDEIEITNLPHFIGSVQRKSDMRKHILQTLNNFKTDKEMYAKFLEQFINMEEEFLENGC